MKIKNLFVSLILYVLGVVSFLTIFSSIAVLLQPEYLGKFIQRQPTIQTEPIGDPRLPQIKIEPHCDWLDDPPGLTEVELTTVFTLYKAILLIIAVSIIILIKRKKISNLQIIRIAFFVSLVSFLYFQILLRNNLKGFNTDWAPPILRIVRPICF